MFKKSILIAIILFGGYCANVQTDPHPEWSAPYQPFRIAGNLYYVGTYDLACYLITTSAANILINTGLAASVDMINNNIKTLGFNPADIRILLTTQAHNDHMSGMAAIQRLTGAKMMVDRGDSSVVADGGRSDGSHRMPVSSGFIQNINQVTSIILLHLWIKQDMMQN
jgi:metallo-beta-lactamase class B